MRRVISIYINFGQVHLFCTPRVAAAEHHVSVGQRWKSVCISRRISYIRNLEDELGTSLLNRHSGDVELTYAGRDNLMQLVSFGKGLTLTSEATTGTMFPGITYRPRAGEVLPFCAIWCPNNDNPALRRLLSLARSMARLSESANVNIQAPVARD